MSTLHGPLVTLVVKVARLTSLTATRSQSSSHEALYLEKYKLRSPAQKPLETGTQYHIGIHDHNIGKYVGPPYN